MITLPDSKDTSFIEKTGTLLFKKNVFFKSSVYLFEDKEFLNKIINIDFCNLEDISSSCIIQNTNIKELDFKNIEHMGSLLIRENHLLEKISFKYGLIIDKNCDLRGNRTLVHFDLSPIKEINGDLLLPKRISSLKYGNISLKGNVYIGNELSTKVTNRIKGIKEE